jgi:hypothetical protein
MQAASPVDLLRAATWAPPRLINSYMGTYQPFQPPADQQSTSVVEW